MAYEFQVTTELDGRWVCTAILRCDHCGTEMARGKSARNTAPTTQDQADATALTARANAQFDASNRHGTHSTVVDARGGCTCPACRARGLGPRDWTADARFRGGNVRFGGGNPHGWNANAPRPTVAVVAPPPPKRYAVTALRPVTAHPGYAEPVEVIAEPDSHEPIIHGELGRNAEPCVIAKPDPVNGGWTVAMLLSVDGISYATSSPARSRYEAQALVDEWVRSAPEAVACVREGMRYFPGDARRAVAESQAKQARARAARGAA